MPKTKGKTTVKRSGKDTAKATVKNGKVAVKGPPETPAQRRKRLMEEEREERKKTHK
jgi:hypothetical protein